MAKSKFVVKQQIKDQLSRLPHTSGIYIMKDVQGEIIYVGKSKDLKNRVSSYFRGFESHMPKVQTMVVNIDEFEYILTDSETEALVLEANLIKKHLPRFNILLKDDKMYPYIKVTLNENFPRVIMTRKYIKDGGKYFGPYVGADQVKKTIEIIQTIFPIRECSKRITSKVDRPCLNYHMGRCAGACNHMITQEDYDVYIQQILRFLNGEREWLVEKLKRQMTDEAEKMNFEKAGELRDKIRALESLNEKQKAVQNNDKNQDFIAYYQFNDQTCVMVFQVRNGKIEGRESYNFSQGIETTGKEILSAFVLQYYSNALYIPKELYFSEGFEDMASYEKWLSQITEHKVTLSVPIKGEKRKIIELVEKNAKEYVTKFQEKIEKDNAIQMNIESKLKELLGFPDNLDLKRIEAYDISNTSGVYSVGSQVVYENGRKKRSDYRRYRVKTIEGANDYGSMQEVLYRRFKRGLEEKDILDTTGIGNNKFSSFPDLLLIDGGKGHVNAVLQILNAMNIYIPVAGMVKDDFHKTEDLYYNGEFVNLKSNMPVFRFIYDIQEEVHRFAIEYHKTLRSKEMVRSVLDEIEGVGEKRKILLLKKFKNIESIRSASLESLMSVNGISEKIAGNIYEYLNSSPPGSDENN